MRLSNKQIDEVVIEVAGEDVVPLVRLLKNKKNISEFKLAEDLGREINTTRNMLYRLHASNLVSFIRKKDKKKGWYIYYWTLEMSQIKYLVKRIKENKIVKFKERLDREKSSQFYACDARCMRLDFDQAVNFEFKCPECGELIHQEDNSEKIHRIEQSIADLEVEIKEFEIAEKAAPKPVQKASKKPKKKPVKKKVKKSKKPVKKTPKPKKKSVKKKVKKSVKKVSKKKVSTIGRLRKAIKKRVYKK